jgi:hypothetical protein
MLGLREVAGLQANANVCLSEQISLWVAAKVFM